MIASRACLTSFVALFLSAAGAMAQESKDAPVVLNIGGRSITVPVPAGGFVRCDGINADWDKAMNAMIPSSNRLLATFGTPADEAGLRAGTPTDYPRNLSVQSLRAYESKEFGTRTFGDMRAQTKKELEGMQEKLDAQIKKVIAEGNRKISEDFGTDAGLEISDTVMLGVFQDDDTSLGFTMAMKVTISSGETPETSKGVVAGLMAPVNGRLVVLYSVANYKSEADRQEVERSVKAWGDAIIAANPVVQGPAAPGLFKNVGRSGVIGAVAGAVIALLLMVKKRLSR